VIVTKAEVGIASEGRKPTHPKYKWGDESRAAKQKRQA